MNSQKPGSSRFPRLVGVYACSLMGLCIVPALAWWCMWCSAMGAGLDDRSLPPQFAKLLPLHTKLGKPLPGDWLDKHPEMGQTYRQYVGSRPVRADRRRNMIYVQPLGDFSSAEKKIIDQATEFLSAYFQLEVATNEAIPLDVIPRSARRKPGGKRAEQILSAYVLDEVLKPRLPKNAVALIAFTNADLWPGEGWNYVFGQASLADHVGVWSIHRYGDPSRRRRSFSAMPVADAEDRLARNRPHVLASPLHFLRVRHVRQQSSGRGRPPAAGSLPQLPCQALLRHRR